MSVWSQPDRVTSLLSGPVKTAISLKRSGPESVFGPPQGNRPDEFFQRFLSLSEVADRCLGRSVIEGREVIGYEVSARKLGFEYLQAGAGKDGQVATVAPGGRLWVDVKTGQPVRLEFETDDSWSGRRVRMVFDQFEWNVPLEDQLFVPDLPPDTRVIEATMPPLTEQTLLDGLRLYASLGHGYPTVLDGSRLTAEVAAGLLAQGKLDRSNPLSAETVQAGLTMTQACAFCQKLARDGREPEYFGDQVTPEDSDQVLMRWRLDDGQVRVIYGDLRAETLPDEK
jgi:hypothetical protein